jgi:hypothetical protein
MNIWVYDSEGRVHSRLSGYSHNDKIYVTEMNVYDAMCMETSFVQGDVTYDSDAIFGIVTVSAQNSQECVDGTITMYYSALEKSPFDSSTETSGLTVPQPPALEKHINDENPTPLP